MVEFVAKARRHLLDHLAIHPRNAIGHDWLAGLVFGEPLRGDVFELAAGIGEVLTNIDLVSGEVRHREPSGGLDERVGVVLGGD